jgi:nucleotide-binding universal stress UspA family protein
MLLGRLAEAIEFQVLTRLGSPAAAILSVATDLVADVIVMAKHGRTGFSGTQDSASPRDS